MNIRWIASDWVGRDQLPLSLKAAGHEIVSEGQDATVYVGTYQTPLALDKLAEIHLDAPLILLVTEGSDPFWRDLLHTYLSHNTFDRIVNIDGNHEWPGSDKGLTTLTPIDPAPFSEPLPWSEKRGMGFSGGVSGYRRSIIPSFVTVRDTPAEPTHENYLDHIAFLKRLKFSLNLRNMEPERGGAHVKGRVLESALSGCCLLEPTSLPTHNWLTPFVEYLPYETPGDISQVTTSNLTRAPEIAINLRDRILRDYNPAKIWGEILDS